MLYAIAAVLALILDQAVKYWVTVSIALETDSVTVIKGVLSLVNVHNPGAAFGILQNARWLFVILAVVFVAVVIVALSKNLIRDPLGRWSAVLVMAGAIGNCIDRVIFGYVVDMFQLEFMNFAVFNVADIFITVCGILFCVYIIFGSDFGDKTPVKAGGPSKKPAKRASRPPVPAIPHEDEDVKIAAPARPAPSPEDGPVRTYQPKPKAAAPAAAPVQARPDPELPKAKPVSFDPTSPFAEWESTKRRPAAPVQPDVEPDTDPVVTYAPAPAAPAPAPQVRQSAPAPDEFSLDDILAEFSSK